MRTEQARIELLRSALRLAADEYNEAEDPGWQQDLDQEIFDKAAIQYVEALQEKANG